MANIIIYGTGVTGQALCKRLCSDNNIWLYDDNPKKSSVSMLDIPYDCIDMCIVSPGISSGAPLLLELQDRCIPIIGEWQYCSPLCRDTLVSVTGTNGKTTITEMIHHILTAVGRRSALLGNGGTPWSSDIGSGNRVTVLESSSFQLERSDGFCPYISVLSNISSDHILYHGSMGSYIASKCNNFVGQNGSQWAIFNLGDDTAMAQTARCNAKVITYSVDNGSANCCILDNNVVLCVNDRYSSPIGVLANYCKHDKSNALCALLVCSILGVSVSDSITALDTYRVASHKLQQVCMHNGITYIDDSKATNISATLSAVDSIEGDIALILGGSNKGYSFDELICNLPANVVGVAVVGDTAGDILDSCYKFGRHCTICANMTTAVICCQQMLGAGGTVLLSPACASFDRYNNYIERGVHFASVVDKVTQC